MKTFVFPFFGWYAFMAQHCCVQPCRKILGADVTPCTARSFFGQRDQPCKLGGECYHPLDTICAAPLLWQSCLRHWSAAMLPAGKASPCRTRLDAAQVGLSSLGCGQLRNLNHRALPRRHQYAQGLRQRSLSRRGISNRPTRQCKDSRPLGAFPHKG